VGTLSNNLTKNPYFWPMSLAGIIFPGLPLSGRPGGLAKVVCFSSDKFHLSSRRAVVVCYFAICKLISSQCQEQIAGMVASAEKREVVVNLYRPNAPLIGHCVETYSIVGEGAPGLTKHIVLSLPDPTTAT
jgi:hypothetical protein